MAHSITQPLRSLLVNGVQRYATCWLFELTDGRVFRFTDHDSELVVDGQTYTPAGSFNASARQHREGLESQNLEIVGFIDSDFVTDDDLRAGYYRNAKLTEFVVDHRYPFAGRFLTNVYYIKQTTTDGESWTAQLEGMLMRLKTRVGGVLSRNCRWRLGDANCGVDLTTYTTTGSVLALVSSRLKFTATLTAGSKPAEYYNDGVIVWTSGLNTGLHSEIQRYSPTGNTITLQVQVPFDIDPSDDFTIRPGCNKLFDGDCKNKFNNRLRYGGFPDIPTNDKALSTPDVRRS